MSTTTALEDPKTTALEHPRRTPETDLVTWRIEIRDTGRWLLNAFHIAPEFLPKDHEARCPRRLRIAEFGDEEIARRVIQRLNHAAPLSVRRMDWGPLAGTPLQELCVRIDRTGASANILFWSPAARAARALLDMPTGRKS